VNNDQLDNVRADQAIRLNMTGQDSNNPTIIAARLAREGWMPKPPIDPDLEEAQEIVRQHLSQKYAFTNIALAAIKRGRAHAAEAKPGLVWVKHDGSTICPVDRDAWVLTKNFGYTPCFSMGNRLAWQSVTHYAIITPPEEDAA
jgi:hypothetical protein